MLKETDVTKSDMRMEKNHWTPRVRGWKCPSPEIYGSPRGVALWPTAAPNTSSLSQAERCGGTGEAEPRREKWSREATPSGTWRDAEGDINWR